MRCAAVERVGDALREPTLSASVSSARRRRADRSSPSSHSIARYGPRRDAVRDVADDAGVRELRQHGRLAQEPLGLADLAEHLQRDDLVRRAVERAKHTAHAALAGERLDREPAVDERARLHLRRCYRISMSQSAATASAAARSSADSDAVTATRTAESANS